MNHRKILFQVEMDSKVEFVAIKNSAKFNVEIKAKDDHIFRSLMEQIYFCTADINVQQI